MKPSIQRFLAAAVSRGEMPDFADCQAVAEAIQAIEKGQKPAAALELAKKRGRPGLTAGDLAHKRRYQVELEATKYFIKRQQEIGWTEALLETAEKYGRSEIAIKRWYRHHKGAIDLRNYCQQLKAKLKAHGFDPYNLPEEIARMPVSKLHRYLDSLGCKKIE